MAQFGGQVNAEETVVIGKRGPKGGTTLKSQQVCYFFGFFFLLL